MKKKFKLEDLDCANCAAKMEDAIKKIAGVNDANVRSVNIWAYSAHCRGAYCFCQLTRYRI